VRNYRVVLAPQNGRRWTLAVFVEAADARKARQVAFRKVAPYLSERPLRVLSARVAA
jgi:hypothetical protein